MNVCLVKMTGSDSQWHKQKVKFSNVTKENIESPGKTSKSQSCVMIETFSLSNFTLMYPLLTQNQKIRLASHNFLHFVHNFLQYGHKLSLMSILTPAGKFQDSGFSCFIFFLFSNTHLESSQGLSFKLTFLGELFEGILWQSLTKSLLTEFIVTGFIVNWVYS